MVAPVGTAPQGSDSIVVVPTHYALRKSNFGFSDVDGDAFVAIRIATLPGAGTLYYDANGELGGGRSAVTAGQTITAADINAGKLSFVASGSGAGYASLTFQVQDSGAGGSNLDLSPNTLTFEVVASAAVPTSFGNLIDLTGLSASNGFKIEGQAGGDQAGRNVSSAGDVNGDGLADILIGSTNSSGGFGWGAGAVYVIFGKASGFASPIELAGLAASDGFKIQGDVAYDQAGRSVSSAGDVNGDGYADILIGATGNASGGKNAGAAYVIFGRASGFGSLIDLTGLAASDGFKIQGNQVDAATGRSASAGDVNGDGFTDILVGAPHHYSRYGGSNNGAAYVIFGKASGFGSLVDLASLAASDGFKIQGEAPLDQTGYGMSSAGDINGDGFADILVGAPRNDSGGTDAGAAYVIFGKASGFGSLVNLAGLAASDGFKIRGDLNLGYAGSSVSSAGDVNGDGFADILVGSPGQYGGNTIAGAAYLIFGKASGFGSLIDLAGLTGSDGFKIRGDLTDTFVGASVSSAGDVNGDGFADILVDARKNDSGGIDAGAAYVIFGKASGFASLIDLTGLATTDGFKIQGDIAKDYAGSSVSSAGDVNGDGFADILVGARGSDNSHGSYAGAAYVIFGRAIVNRAPAGTDAALTIAPTYALRAVDFGFSDVDGHRFQAVKITTLPGAGTLYYDANGGLAGGRTPVTPGQTISVADIFASKLVFVAPAGASGSSYASFTFQVQDDGGTANGGLDLDPTADTLTFNVRPAPEIPAAFGRTIDLTGLSAANGFKIQGDMPNDRAGLSVSSAGDFNGDGFADMLIGTGMGPAYVVFGKAQGLANLIDLTGLTASDGFKIQGNLGTAFHTRTVSSAGDVNGDGFGDIVVGSMTDGGGGTQAGAAYVIFGKTMGFGNLLDLAKLAIGDGFKIQGDRAYDRAGYSVSSAGDVNGDGFADILIGVRDDDSGGNNAGAAYVIFGKASGFGSLIDLTGLSAANGFKIQGHVQGDAAGSSVSSAGDVNGDGYDDVIVGAPTGGNGAPGTAGNGAYVIFGKAGGFGSLIDLTGLAASNGFKIQGGVLGRAVSSAGDINRDGFADILVGSPSDNGGDSLTGSAYVIFGKASGFGTTVDLASLTASDGFRIQGDNYNDQVGWSVSSGGDVNGDGYADILIGSRNQGSGGVNAGAAYVIFGHADGFGSLIDLTGLYPGIGFKIQGDMPNDRAGWGLSSAGDVNGDGFDDVLVGAELNDGGGTDSGAAYVIYGRADGTSAPGTSGVDTLNGTDGANVFYLGQGGDDVVSGGAGDDGFNFGANFTAADIVDGGAGTNDQLALDGDYTITLGSNVTNVEALILLHGPTATPNHFDITSGDAFVPAGETRTVWGLPVETAITFNGSGELDGAFKVFGGTGADTLTGGAGADWIFGGNGADALTGGGGNDTFAYDAVAQSTPTAGDILFDFALGDRIDVSGIDAIAGGADNAFTYLGSGAFTNAAGQLRAVDQGGSWLVQADINGDGVADFQLSLIPADAHPITSADFVL